MTHEGFTFLVRGGDGVEKKKSFSLSNGETLTLIKTNSQPVEVPTQGPLPKSSFHPIGSTDKRVPVPGHPRLQVKTLKNLPLRRLLDLVKSSVG